ncbi:photosynthetic complex putative assembly protein PuhB [uncultured Erythrobacter sp.]|uniref:photosynthetic complex putative assembly protein PuhB n=1 Tax=uncultured Erythrobacter sp. TaxID=263913 RepID=UPI00262AF5CB|nr:photosynthetic complex putative assembly protein PuhB [uncultured Erythrobacter sp.]
MDLSTTPERTLSKTAQELEEAGPAAHGDPMGTPSHEEKVLWKGRPDLPVFARTAFHTRTVGLYFAALVVISMALGNMGTAIVCAVLGVLAVAILYGLAWLSARTTLYILTDARLIMRIGMAIETRVNLPLRHVQSANLKARGESHGDIALMLGGERLLGYALLWPHARPWRYASPEPMLRAVPEAEKVARILAEACAKHVPVEQNLMQINEAQDGVADSVLTDAEMRGALT